MHATRVPFRGAGRRGIAILSVVTVLVALLVIAIPFVISMKLGRERTESSAARSRATFEAGLVCRAVVSYVAGTHPHYEQTRRAQGQGGYRADESYDSEAEVVPPPSYRDTIAAEMAKDGGPAASVSDPRGSVWSWRVVDANALVNPNGASPLLLGNLLGSATVAVDVDAAATTIPVENVAPLHIPGATPFKKDGGWIRIGTETIRYASFDAGQGFVGCERGALRGSAPLLDNGPPAEHKRGELVVDQVAYKLATNLIAAKPGTLTRFDNLEKMKTIQAWGGGGVLDAARFESILPYVTVWSLRETAETFLDGQAVINALPEAARTTGAEILRFRDKVHVGGNAAYFNTGTMLRITDGQQADFAVVAFAGDDKGGQLGAVTTLATRLPEGRLYEGGRALAEPLAPYPINVNTASREVLTACFSHLRMRSVNDPTLVVTPTLAWDLAGRIVESRGGEVQLEGGGDDVRKGGPFRRAEDFDRFLADLQKGGVIKDRQREALVRNAINPHDNEIAYGTAPFCYRTMDVYSVEGRAVVNDSGGNKAAEVALRQIVQVGADQATVWSIESQADFEAGLSLGSGGKYVETYPINMGFVSEDQAHVQPRKRAPQMIQRGNYPSSSRDPDIGDVRLQAARVKLYQSPVLEDHMDTSVFADGWLTDQSGPYTKPVNGTLRKGGDADPWIHPFTIATWMRPYTTGTFWIFDTGKESDQNRISLFVRDGEQGRELTFRICDATLQGTGAELFVPLDRLGYKPQTWYHLQATARGADPAQMELLVDGVSVGHRRGLTYLSSTLSSTDMQMAVEDTSGFEPKGAVLVGSEVVEYDSSTGTSFAELFRARRGTRGIDWPKGTPVQRVGYSHPLTLELRKGGAGLEQKLWAPWGFMRVMNFTKETNITWTDPDDPRLSVTFKGLNDSDTKDTCTLVKESNVNGTSRFEDLTETDQVETFSSQGYAVMVCPEFNTQGKAGATQKIGGWEVVWYTRSGTQMTIERYQTTALHADSGTPYFVTTELVAPLQGNEGKVKTYIAPISFLGKTSGSGAFDYLDFHDAADKEKLEANANDGDPDGGGYDSYARPRVLVGTTEGREDEGTVECIAYDSLDRTKSSGGLLFVRDDEDSLLRLKSGLITYGLLPPTGNGLPTEPPPAPAAAPPPAPPPGGTALAPSKRREAPVVAVALALEGDRDGDDDSAPPQEEVKKELRREPTTNDSGGGGAEPSPGTGAGKGAPEPPRPPMYAPGDPGPTSNGSDNTFDPPPVNGLAIRYPFRGVNDTLGKDQNNVPGTSPGIFHASISPDDENARLLPCFRVQRRDVDTGLQIGGPAPGYDDNVTLSTGTGLPRRELRRVRWAHAVPDGGSSSSWLALSEFVDSGTFVPEDDAAESRSDNRGRTRLMKFPTGELPDEQGQNLVFGKNEVGAGGVVRAFFDELYVWRHANPVPIGVVVNQDMVSEEADEITVRALPPATTLDGIDGWDTNCGVLDVGGELVVWRGTRPEGAESTTFERCARGALGTRPHTLAPGMLVRLVPNVLVSYLSGMLSRDASTIAVGRTKDWPREGLVRIVGQDQEELVHFMSRNDTDLVLPEALDADETVRGRGLTRGRFGTETVSHDNDELVIWQPFRFWDRFLPRRGNDTATFSGIHDHAEGCYVEFAKTVQQAQWRRASWQENLKGQLDDEPDPRRRRTTQERTASEKLDLLVLVRFDQGVPWDSKKVVDLRGNTGVPSDARDHPERYLYLFDDPDAANRLDFEADTAEFRVYYRYLPGCFVAQDLTRDAATRDDLVFENTWKQTPWLQAFTVEYVNRTKERYQAEIR
jgi:hypothetical protein